MIRPVYLLGTKALREQTTPIESNSEDIQALVDDMIETMRAAKGIGLAAPQIGRNERLFVVDVSAMEEDFEEMGVVMPDQPMVFINAEIVDESEHEGEFEEGCLSIPDIHEIVVRPQGIRIHYLDRNFESREETYSGILARVIQHEYDHVDGVLFLDHLTAFKRRLLKRKLDDIRNGMVDADYPTYTDTKGVIEASVGEED